MEQWEWAWLGGIFEGEGNIEFSFKSSVRLRVSMTDKDVIETIDRLCPSPRGIYARRRIENRKQQYAWERSDRDEVKAFLEGVLPYLHSRRRAKAEEALERLKSNLGAKPKRTHCKYGHPLSGENLYVARLTGARSCQICRARRSREGNARRKAARELLDGGVLHQ